MKLLVVGGAGYIGSVVAAQLIEAGHTVTVADNLSKGHDWAVPPKATFVQVDVLDAPALTEVVGGGFDGVLHFAALLLVGESVTEPVRYFRTNVAGTLNLLDAIRSAGVGRRLLVDGRHLRRARRGADPRDGGHDPHQPLWGIEAVGRHGHRCRMHGGRHGRPGFRGDQPAVLQRLRAPPATTASCTIPRPT